MQNPQQMWYLEGINLFGRLCPMKMESSDDLRNQRKYRAGEMIYMTGDVASYIHIVVSGRVRIGNYLDNGQMITKAILSEGEVFGEMALAGQSVRSDFAESMDGDTALCLIRIEEVLELMHREQDLSLRIIKWIGWRMVRLERKIALLTFRDARTRIVEFLKDAAAYKGKPIGDEMLIKTRLTHADIASLTGTSRQTVSEVLNELRAENQIYFERGRILIRDVNTIH